MECHFYIDVQAFQRQWTVVVVCGGPVSFFSFAILSREQPSFWTRGNTIGLILSHGVCEKCKKMEKESMFKDTFI